jgi:hypothetical protein
LAVKAILAQDALHHTTEAKMKKKEPLPEDPLISYNSEGVPVAKDKESETSQVDVDRSKVGDDGLGPDRPTHEKKRQGTEEAQKRSDTGTGL